ncbi:MAG TPA: ABC transporter permease [Vicinamibacterales bacterium]|nr:ABC transporter permease [Vicinamibacterales bacterium]
MKTLLARLRIAWRGLTQPSQLDREMDDEMRFHIDMETQRLMKARGLGHAEARRHAAIAFGGVEKYRGAGRDALGVTWMRGLSSDLKLGARMLRKYPGLTAVALFALSLAIGAGAAYLEFLNDLMHGKLPFPESDRIVGIQTWDQESGETEARVTADFVSWRLSLRSFEVLGASRQLDGNLITDDGRAEPVRGVQITASAFALARVPAMLGRTLQTADEQPGASPVAVIGYELWQTRFASDASIVGRTIRLGRDLYTVVGVMPQGFGFPINHSLWVPLPLNEANYPYREGPSTRVFGKLAATVSVRQAQAELDAVAHRAARDQPKTHAHLRPVVKPFVESVWSAVEDSRIQTIVFYSANVFFIGLLALCGANIATLVFARTATRETEITVRTALGASRARIAGQLFAEALVLSSLAAAIGLGFAYYGLRWVKNAVVAGQKQPIMFWWNDRIAPETMLYAAVLAVFAAAIVGVVPALKATGIRVQERLKHATGTTASGLKFGGIWTGVIVTQVGVTVVFLAIVGMLAWSAYVTGGGKRQPTFPAEQYVSVRLALDVPADDPVKDDAYRQQFRSTFTRLSDRLSAYPDVAALTYGRRLPGMNPFFAHLEIADIPASQQPSTPIRTADVAANYFDTFDAPILAGRSFTEADSAGVNVAIVDRTFVRLVLKDQEAIGRHVRRAASETKPAGPWMQIVGVVRDLTDETGKRADDAMIYTPTRPEATYPVHLAVRARTNPAVVMSELRIMASEIDPALRLYDLQTLDNVSEADRVALDLFARLLAGVSLVALVLATAGVYALMSFTVSRRTAEIGVRVALGAKPSRILWTTFGRSMLQVALGVLLGSIPAALLVAALGPEVSAENGTNVAIATGVMATVTVCAITAIACIAPARRALKIQPSDALKTT